MKRSASVGDAAGEAATTSLPALGPGGAFLGSGVAGKRGGVPYGGDGAVFGGGLLTLASLFPASLGGDATG